MAPLRDQVAIVTGASKGIGKAIATALARSGARVVLVARTRATLEAAASELRAAGHAVLAVPADIGEESDVSTFVSRTAREFGRIDILVNNAGVGVFGPVAKMEVKDFDLMWKVNMRGVFLATRGVLPYMLEANTGQIVNIGSLAGKNSVKDGAAYAATKWALRGFASSLMLEVRDANIRVITIFPGSVDTNFSPRGKRGAAITQPEDVADAVMFALNAPPRSMFSEIDVRPTIPK